VLHLLLQRPLRLFRTRQLLLYLLEVLLQLLGLQLPLLDVQGIPLAVGNLLAEPVGVERLQFLEDDPQGLVLLHEAFALDDFEFLLLVGQPDGGFGLHEFELRAGHALEHLRH
jgi:hypothetical protein